MSLTFSKPFIEKVSLSINSNIIHCLIRNYYEELRIISYCEKLDYENINKINSIYIPNELIIQMMLTSKYKPDWNKLNKKFIPDHRFDIIFESLDYNEIITHNFVKKMFDIHFLHNICKKYKSQGVDKILFLIKLGFKLSEKDNYGLNPLQYISDKWLNEHADKFTEYECNVCFDISDIQQTDCGCTMKYCLSCIKKINNVCSVCKNLLKKNIVNENHRYNSYLSMNEIDFDILGSAFSPPMWEYPPPNIVLDRIISRNTGQRVSDNFYDDMLLNDVLPEPEHMSQRNINTSIDGIIDDSN